MKQLIAVLLICCALNACKEEKKEKKFDEETYEKSKESLADKEKNNPARFLKVDNRDRRNLLGQTVLIGHLENTATVCTYKDVELRLSFFSKTGVQLDEAFETVYETIPPGKKIKFKLKYFSPKGTDSAFIKVVKASGEIETK
jgi:hypothetical protein